jgi:hypothetical protein
MAVEHRPEAFEAALRVAEGALALGATRSAATALHTAERVAGADPEKLAILSLLRQRVRETASVSAAQ